MIGAALASRFLPYIGGGLAVLALLVGVYQAGANAERRRGEAATLRVELETVIRDRDIAQRTLLRVADDLAELSTAKKENEEQIDALRQIVADRADPGLTQSELDGLLNIR